MPFRELRFEIYFRSAGGGSVVGLPPVFELLELERVSVFMLDPDFESVPIGMAEFAVAPSVVERAALWSVFTGAAEFPVVPSVVVRVVVPEFAGVFSITPGAPAVGVCSVFVLIEKNAMIASTTAAPIAQYNTLFLRSGEAFDP